MRKTIYNSGRWAAWIWLALPLAGAGAQLLEQPPLPPKVERTKQRPEDLEWMWQYSSPPAEGREREFLEDPHFLPFLKQHFTAPQSFWGPQQDRTRKSLAETAYDFLAVPGRVRADENRYITVTGAVFHLPASRGLLFADLNSPHPLTVFAAIDWIRDARTTDDPGAQYTLWIFPNRVPLEGSDARRLPPALVHTLARWMAEPLPGSGIRENVTAAVLVSPDGTPTQIPVPRETAP